MHVEFGERGNQRERDRERAQARAGGKSKQPKGDGLTPEQRRERMLRHYKKRRQGRRRNLQEGTMQVVVD
ncbi:hypothetical protein CFP56_013616 [Quercus suber]|uniref:Small EDRK-rich factor-like N-terminal domain-containing protein n=1 Tax=Quercus suber TaxID=58331 RepID=A0AAW0KUF0_QUESU